jgi:hypothetical protein
VCFLDRVTLYGGLCGRTCCDLEQSEISYFRNDTYWQLKSSGYDALSIDKYRSFRVTVYLYLYCPRVETCLPVFIIRQISFFLPFSAVLMANRTVFAVRTLKIIQDDQNVSVHLMITVQNSVYSNNPHTIDDLKMDVTEYIRNVDRAILNTVFENTVQRVNKCLETGGGHFEHYL